MFKKVRGMITHHLSRNQETGRRWANHPENLKDYLFPPLPQMFLERNMGFYGNLLNTSSLAGWCRRIPGRCWRACYNKSAMFWFLLFTETWSEFLRRILSLKADRSLDRKSQNMGNAKWGDRDCLWKTWSNVWETVKLGLTCQRGGEQPSLPLEPLPPGKYDGWASII